MKTLWKNEPLLIVTVLGGLVAFLLDNWPAVSALLLNLGISEIWLNLALMLLTALVGRAFVKPAWKDLP